MNFKNFSRITGMLTGLLYMMAAASTLTYAWLYLSPAGPVRLVFFFSLAFVMLGALIPSRKGVLTEALNQVGARMIYDNAVQFLASRTNPNTGLPYNAEKAVCTMSYLRSEVALEAGRSSYNMPIIQNNRFGPDRVNNNVVALQDVLYVNRISVSIGIGTATDGAAKLYTYPNQIAFSTSGAAAALWSIYNSQMILLNNNSQVVPALNLTRFYKAPAIQAITDLYYDGTAVQQDQLDLGSDSFVAQEPGWLIDGSQKMALQITSQSTGPAVVQANSFICVIMEGLLFQNITKVV
jgi:hypothetical protein